MIPEDLTALEYARHLLENTLAWPAKGNIELIADCLSSLSRAKKLTLPQALTYMERAVRLAKEQGIKVDRHWIMGGEYVNVRPQKAAPIYQPIDKEATEREQATPEWQELAEKARQAWAKLAGKSL